MRVIESGLGEFKVTDPDEMREFVRNQKRREMVDKLMSEHEAISRFVHDGAYVSFDFSSLTRGPCALVREMVRQRKRELWFAAKFTLMETGILAAAGCLKGIDVGFMGLGEYLAKVVAEGKIKVSEWTNGTLTLRHLAGAMGIPFIPTKAMLGTDTLKYSGAKVVEDPFTGKSIVLIPAVNPDVGLIHAHQCDIYGNARCFGPGVSPLETAMASKRTIVSAEQIVSHEEIRKDPAKTTIPYYLVDAVVHQPFGAYPGGVQGMYEMDAEHLMEWVRAQRTGGEQEYLEKYIYSVSSHREFLEKRVGIERLAKLIRDATIKEGYS